MQKQEIEYQILGSIKEYPKDELIKLSKYLAKKNKYTKGRVCIDPANTSHDFGVEGHSMFAPYSKLTCLVCGCSGIVMPHFMGIQLISVLKIKKDCDDFLMKSLQSKKGVKVRLIKDLSKLFGVDHLKEGCLYTCVACPNEHMEKYSNHYWVDAGLTENGIPSMLRLLPNEFKIEP